MTPLGPLDAAECAVLAKARALLAAVRRHAESESCSVAEAVATLAALRQEVYEDLNQIQHEYLIICAANWLRHKGPTSADASWHWNPRQTGDETEPDLAAELRGDRILSAEVTASAEPKGIIDKRMTTTLAKLNRMAGAKFYFVRTEAMRRRAGTKVAKKGWAIRVICLGNGADAL